MISMVRKWSFSIASLALIFSLFLGACTASAAQIPTPTPLPPTPTPAPISLQDGLGRTVTLPSPAQRVVSLAPSNTEILFAIGAGAQVIGRDEFSNYPAEVANLPSVGGSFNKFSNEAIVNLKPDLVLAAEINTPEQVKALEDLGVTVFLLPNPLTLDEMYRNLGIVAQLTGHEADAAKLVDTLRGRVEAVTAQMASVTTRPTVFYELDSTNPQAPYTAGPGTFIDTLIGMAGGKNVGAALSSSWASISIEELVVQNPDVILLGDSAYGVTVESVAQRPGWEGLAAVKDGKVYPFNDDLASRPGPRLVDGLEAMAKLLHPELFK